MFLHKDMHRLSLEFCAVIAHGNPDHGEGEHIIGGKKTNACNIYDLPDCKSHEDMRMEVSKMKLLEGVRGTPTHIFYNPHNLEEFGRTHYMSRSNFEDKIAEYQKILGKPVRWKDFEKSQKSIDEARALIAEKDYRKALRAMKGFDARGMKGLEQQAEAVNAEIMAAGEALLAEAEALAESGENDKAIKILRSVSKDFSGTDLAKLAKKRIAELKD